MKSDSEPLSLEANTWLNLRTKKKTVKKMRSPLSCTSRTSARIAPNQVIHHAFMKNLVQWLIVFACRTHFTVKNIADVRLRTWMVLEHTMQYGVWIRIVGVRVRVDARRNNVILSEMIASAAKFAKLLVTERLQKPAEGFTCCSRKPPCCLTIETWP